MEARVHLADFVEQERAAIRLFEFADAARFYKDALNDNVEGYLLIYQDDFGVAYISTTLYDQYFK